MITIRLKSKTITISGFLVKFLLLCWLFMVSCNQQQQFNNTNKNYYNNGLNDSNSDNNSYISNYYNNINPVSTTLNNSSILNTYPNTLGPYNPTTQYFNQVPTNNNDYQSLSYNKNDSYNDPELSVQTSYYYPINSNGSNDYNNNEFITPYAVIDGNNNSTLTTNVYNINSLPSSSTTNTTEKIESTPIGNWYEYESSTTKTPLWKDPNPYFGIPQYHVTTTPTVQNITSTNSNDNATFSMCEIIPSTNMTNSQVCDHPIQKYYFNKTKQECESFLHTSCDGGVEMYFSTYDHCSTLCKVYYKNTLIADERVEPKDNIKLVQSNNVTLSTLNQANNNSSRVKVNSLVKFTIVQIWDNIFDTDKQFNLIKTIKIMIKQIYENPNIYNTTFLDISPKMDEIIPVNLTLVRIMVTHLSDVDPLEPLVDATINHRTLPLVILRESWSYENISDENEQNMANICNRMDIPMSFDCKSSKYGCCYDNVMIASGPNKQGCPEKNCPCKLFMVSFGVTNDISRQIKYNYDWAVHASNKFMNELNQSYNGEIKDSFIDWRDCMGKYKNENKTTELSVIDLAILLNTAHYDPFKPLFDLFKISDKIGDMDIIKNSLIISHAYGVSDNDENIELYKPVLHLDFNKNDHINGATRRNQVSDNNPYCGEALDLSNSVNKKLFDSHKIIKHQHNKQLTIAFWIYNRLNSFNLSNNNSLNVLWAKNNNPSQNWPLFYIHDNKMFANYFFNNHYMTCSDLLTNKSSGDSWTHIVITFNSLEGKIRLFQDGNALKSCTNNNSINQSLTPIKEIIIGDETNNKIANQGFLDELFIYKEILSHTSIKKLFFKCTNTSNISNKNGMDDNIDCNSECPPPIINNDNTPNNTIPKNNFKDHHLYPIRSCMEYQTRCSRYRSGLYEAVFAMNDDETSYIKDNSTMKKNDIYCNMVTAGGGWELVLNNINGDGWSASQLLGRENSTPSLNTSYSNFGKFINFITDNNIEDKQYMIIVTKNDYTEGGIWNISYEKKNNSYIILEKKFGDWSNQSSFNTMLPYIFDDGHDVYITTSYNPKIYPYGTLASTTGLMEPYMSDNFDIIFSVSLWIRYKFKNFSKNIEIFDEMNQTVIEQYYLNAEIINSLDYDIIVYYDMVEEKKWLEVSAHNRSSLFNIIHSISMPLSVTFSAYEKGTLKQLYINGRHSFESPISYIPNDFVIMIISDKVNSQDKPLIQIFNYDYIFYNSLNYTINVTVNFMDMPPAQYQILPYSFENWKTRFYSPQKILFYAIANSNQSKSNLFIEGKSLYAIEPMIPNINTTNILTITEESFQSQAKQYHSCYSYLNINSTLPYSLDIFWRDDTLLITLKPFESQKILLKFNYLHPIIDLINNISIYACVHGRFYDMVCDIQINGNDHFPIKCFESDISYSINLVLTSNRSQQQLEKELNDIKYNIYSLGGENICPPEINGGYSDWTVWSECYTDKQDIYTNNEYRPSYRDPIVKRLRSRFRICNNPSPKNGGMDCNEQFDGSGMQTELCLNESLSTDENNMVINKANFTPKTITITLENGIDAAVAVMWEILLNTNQTWQRGNVVISQNSSRNITLNNKLILNSGTISFTAKNLETGDTLMLRDAKHLVLQLDLLKEDIIIVIGREKSNVLRRFYAQFIVINQENYTASISLSKDGTLLSLAEEIPPNNVRATFKYSFVSLTNRPSPIIVQPIYNNTPLYINGLSRHVVRLSYSQYEYVVLNISQKMTKFKIENSKYINFIVNNMNPFEEIQIKIKHSLMPPKTLILGPTNLISVYRKITLPFNYQLDPIEILAKKHNGDMWKSITTLPLINPNNFIEFIPIDSDLEYEFSNMNPIYYLNIRITNVGKNSARVEWRKGVPEQIVTPGNELRVHYNIRSPSTLPVFTVRAYDSIYESDLFINGKNISHLITSYEDTNYTNTLLISSNKEKGMIEDIYFDMVNFTVKVFNYLTQKDAILYMYWNETNYESINVLPYTYKINNYTIPHLDEAIIVQAYDKYGIPLTVNMTYRLGLKPLENNTIISLYIGDKPTTNYFGVKLLNIYKRNNITVYWDYRNMTKSSFFTNENQIELVMRLTNVDIQPLTLWCMASNNRDMWSINHAPHKLIIPSTIIRSIVSNNLNSIQWISLSVGSGLSSLDPSNNKTTKVLTHTYIQSIKSIIINFIPQNPPLHLFISTPEDQTYQYVTLDYPQKGEIDLVGCTYSCSNLKTLTIIDNNGNLLLINNTISTPLNFTDSSKIYLSHLVEKTPKKAYNHIIIRNNLHDPSLLYWETITEGDVLKSLVYIGPYANVDIKNEINFLSNLPLSSGIRFKAIFYRDPNLFLMINQTDVFTLNFTNSQVVDIYLVIDSRNLSYNTPGKNLYDLSSQLYTVLLDNTLLLTVQATLNDKNYYIEPKGMLEINLKSPMDNKILPVILTAKENVTQFPLLLNGTTSQIEFTLNRNRPEIHVKISPPHLPLLPKSSYLFLELENEGKIEDEPSLLVHGTLYEYKNERNKSIGILFNGDKIWVGAHLTGSNCIIEPTYCLKGFTIALRLMLPSSKENSTMQSYIVDSGGHGGDSSGVTLSVEDGKLHFQVTTLSKTWMVNTNIPLDTFFTVIASWQPEIGLYLYIDGILVSSEHNGEMLFSTQDIDISPNLLFGRNINGNNIVFNNFVLVYVTIFDKYFNQQEALMTYLQLSDPRHAKAQFNQLRLFNQVDRPTKLEVSTNGNYPNKVLVPSDTNGDILTLIDMNRTNEEISMEKHVNIPRSRYVVISAKDSELGKLLYVNNQPSPVRLTLSNDYMEYADVILSAPTKIVKMKYYWVFLALSQDGRRVEFSSPTIFTYGNVIESQMLGHNKTLSLDGISGFMQIDNFKELECLTQPLFCEKGFTIIATVRLNEIINDDNNPHFILDTGGHNGKGFSLYYLGGRLLGEVSQNRKVWRIETRLIIGEWIMISLTWTPQSGGKLSMMINGNDYKQAEKSSDLQGTSSYSNATFIIGKPVVDSTGSFGKFFIKNLAIADFSTDENDLIDYFLFYNNHNKIPSATRYISVNFQNRAGQDILIKPDRGEYQTEGYLINAGLMLELRLEEKGTITTYPITFKAYGLSSDKNYLLNNDWSVVVAAEEDQSLVTNVVITTALSCPQEEGLFPDPNDKTKFISCQDGIARREKCPPNSLWNDNIKSCSIFENQKNKPQINVLSNKNISENRPIYFILKNATPKNVTIVKVYDSADAFTVTANSSLIWRPKSNLKYPTAFIALEGSYEKNSLGGRLLINGQNVMLINSNPFANKTIFIIHEMGTDWRHEMYNLMKKLYGYNAFNDNNVKKRIELIVINIAGENVHIFDTQNILFDFIMNRNEIFKIKIANNQSSKSIILATFSGDSTSNSTYMINNQTSYTVFDATKNIISKENDIPKVLVIHEKDDSNWEEVYKKFVELQKEINFVGDNQTITQYNNTSNRSFFELTLRISLMTPLDISLREITGTNFKVGIKSELAKDNVATDLQLSLHLSSDHQLIFTAMAKDGDEEKQVLINGRREWKLSEISNITGSTVPAVIHELGQSWINNFNSLVKSIAINMTTSKSQIIPYSLLWNYPQLFHLTVKFYIDIDTDAVIKSSKGILNITTTFPSQSTGTIDLYIPETAIITFIARDINGNHLDLDGNDNISVSVSSPIYHVVKVTRKYLLNSSDSDINGDVMNKSLIGNDLDKISLSTNNTLRNQLSENQNTTSLVNSIKRNNNKQEKNLGSIDQLFS